MLCSVIPPVVEMPGLCHSVSLLSILQACLLSPIFWGNQRQKCLSIPLSIQFLIVGHYPTCCCSPQSMPWRCFIKEAVVVASSFHLLSRIIIKMWNFWLNPYWKNVPYLESMCWVGNWLHLKATKAQLALINAPPHLQSAVHARRHLQSAGHAVTQHACDAFWNVSDYDAESLPLISLLC